MYNISKSSYGFTLIEILVAMTIIAIAMAALIKASGDYTTSAAYLKQKTLAHYVAMNELNKLQIAHTWPAIGTDKTTVNLASHDWAVKREILETADPATHAARFTIFIDADYKQAVSSLQGYLSQHTGVPVAAGNGL
jgi:general secretion pathway protein I